MEQDQQRGGARGKRQPQVVVIQRTNLVYQLIASGQRKTADIQRSIARAVHAEREAAEKAKRENKKPAPPIWSEYYETEDGVPKRTLQFYIHKAKVALEEEGRQLPTQGNLILGVQMARINDLYQRALTAGKFAVCAKLIEETNDMFGIAGTVRLHVTTGDEPPQEVPEAEFTTEQAVDEFTRWRLEIERRKAAAMAGSPDVAHGVAVAGLLGPGSNAPDQAASG